MTNKEQEEEQTRDLIQLIDGTILKCYRKDSVQKTLLDDEMNLDSTGTFFRLKDKRSAKKIEADTRSMLNRKEDEDLQFFLDHAFLFYRNAEAILKDSRMFLAPVPVRSGLAYSGGSGFASPTLGVYIEWWLRNEQLVCRDHVGNKTRQLEESYRAVSLRLCEFLVAPLVEEYRVRRDAYMASEEQFQLDKSSCRVLFETGEISSDEYQRMLTPFTKKRKEGRKAFVDYMNQQVARISSEEHIPISIIWEWLESKGCPRVQK